MCYFHKKRRIRHLWQLYWLAIAVVLTYQRSSTDFAKTLRWYGKVAILTAKRASWKTNICTQEKLRLQISDSQKALCNIFGRLHLHTWGLLSYVLQFGLTASLATKRTQDLPIWNKKNIFAEEKAQSVKHEENSAFSTCKKIALILNLTQRTQRTQRLPVLLR